MGDKRLFLLDSFSENGKFYIVSKSTILVTNESEIEIGRKVQFAHTTKEQDIEMAKIKTGKIVMKSGKYFQVFNLKISVFMINYVIIIIIIMIN